MTTDNRANEPTDEQVEAAAQLMWKERALGTTTPEYPWRGLAEEGRERLRIHARDVLTVAGIVPVQPSSTVDGITDVLGFIDKTIDNGEGGTWTWGNHEVMEMLAEIRGKVEAIGGESR